jgi:hypothetical protein
MGSWHTAVSPCHCDNPLYCGLMFLKRKKEKKFKSRFTKRVVTLGLVGLGLAGLGLAGHQDPRLRRLYFLIFSDGFCSGGFDFLIFFFFMSLVLDLVFYLVFHMVSSTFRVIKSQKELTFIFRL